MTSQRFGEEPGQPRRRSGPGATVGRAPGSGAGFAPEQSDTISTITSQIQSALDHQVATGARTVTNVARSARRAADELESDAPQIAGLVRSMANRVEEYSRNLENQSVTDIYQTASDFTRRQPAVVFGVAALAGFFALRTLKSSSTSSGSGRRASRSDEFHGS